MPKPGARAIARGEEQCKADREQGNAERDRQRQGDRARADAEQRYQSYDKRAHGKLILSAGAIAQRPVSSKLGRKYGYPME